MFGFLAGVTKLGFSTGVLILAQRQTVLVAKHAACLDVLCDGRFRLGVGVGWNAVEFTGLNENFRNRGRRSEEQVEVMQKLWADAHVEFAGQYHRIEDAGLRCSGSSPDGRLVEFIELPEHPYLVGTQAHPEFKSRPDRPHPLFLGLVDAALQRAEGRDPHLLDVAALG